VSWPELPLESRVANTVFRPSIIDMYDCSGANGALSSGSVKLVVVAVALGRQFVRPGLAPSG
jgi:hypothetical protein